MQSCKLCGRHRRDKGVKVESILLEGHPADELIRYAEENEMDTIFMGTLGRTGIDRLILGSVAGNVVRHSEGSFYGCKE